MSVLAVTAVLSWVIAALAAWLGYRLLKENGQVLLRLASLERYFVGLQDQLDSLTPRKLPHGLPSGLEAPPFTALDLSGAPVSLEDFLGRRVLLIFFSPACIHCQAMAPEIAALPPDGGAGGPVPVVVTTGDREANLKLVEEHGIRCPVLLQEELDVAMRYGAIGSPLGYLVDERGLLASGMAVGSVNVLALARLPSPSGNGDGHPAEALSEGGSFTLGHTSERMERGGGLAPGAWAPVFRLPRLDGGKVSLADYRGRRVLLIFSDPHCGGCDRLAPELESLHRRSPGFEILMITRGGLEDNRAKVSALGLTFPVALQRSWEISRQYRKFATPCAYLVNAEGNIAAPVAVGGVILELAARAERERPAEKPAPMSWREFRGGGGESGR